ITTSQEWNDIINSPYGISIFNDLNDVQKTIESILNKIDNIFFIQNENILLESLIIHLLIKIADSFSKIKTKNKIGGAYLNKVITIIHRDIGSNISVNKIAEEINVSASYLQRIFKLHFSTSIMKYINNIRLQLAKNHLVNTNDSINQILKKYGFRSKQQFVYQFKSIYQMTPVQFRNAYFTQILPDNSIEYQEKSIKVD
ncbi:MAG: AraC family transcriptional regulator, partial [Endomicrobiaceae bacterium]|nr:AraC family transcriptional regulator [Endomicrobiaceae bacterium]